MTLVEVTVRQGGWRRTLIPGDGPLARVPPAAAFLLVVLLFGAGVLTGGLLGALLLAVLAVLVGLLLAAAWPRLAPPDRAVRTVVLLVVVAVAVLQLD